MGPRRARPSSQGPSSEPQTPKRDLSGGLFGGLDLTFDGPKFGPDGEPLRTTRTWSTLLDSQTMPVSSTPLGTEKKWN